MTGSELVDLLSRLTVHMDEELRGLAFQSLQTLVVDFPDWRQDVVWGFTQFLVRDVLDTFPQLIDSGLRMLLQLLTAWKVALTSPNSNNLNSSIRLGNLFLILINYGFNQNFHLSGKEGNGENIKQITKDLGSKRTDNQKPEPVPSVLHLVEAYALVMLCHYRLSTRRLSVHILRDVKTLLKVLNCSEDQPIIDVIDQCCYQIVEKCIPFLPAAEKTAIQAVSNIDLQWLADRNACIWTAGLHEDGNTKNGMSFSLGTVDPWSSCLFGFLEKGRVISQCPTAVIHSWPIVYSRVNTLYPVIDPT